MTEPRTRSTGEERILGSGLEARALYFSYRYCSNCAREWPADRASCPTCTRYLGDGPLVRREWRMTPQAGSRLAGHGYELVAASAVALRLVAETPSLELLEQIAAALAECFGANEGAVVTGVPRHGWLISTTRGARHGFLNAIELEDRFRAAKSAIEQRSHWIAGIRWGIWVDQYILPLTACGRPAPSESAARTMFDFEPENTLLASQAIYDGNRQWEHFVCAPRRAPSGRESFGYSLLGHKRPSALDHAAAADTTPFVARTEELALITDAFARNAASPARAAIIADAGAGKTRLVREWRRQHPDVPVLSAAFSLFGGDYVCFAAQLAPLPRRRISMDGAIASILDRVASENIGVLVMDDLHWADAQGITFARRLLHALPNKAPLVLLMARPSGRRTIEALGPSAVQVLKPLATGAAKELARCLITSSKAADVATRRSRGNPLFVEHFARWAEETGYAGGDHAPRSLFQLIQERIAHLSGRRLARVRDQLRWGSSWERRGICQALDALEYEIGLWLDRLETGDFGGRVEVSRHLMNLERLEFEIFMARTLSGQPRARSSRLRESIDRLTVASAAPILADLRARAARADPAEAANICREAEHGGDTLAAAFRWQAAAEFYRIAMETADKTHARAFSDRVETCLRRCGEGDTTWIPDLGFDIDENPAVDDARAPEVWAQLGLRCGSASYLRRAAKAAESINDVGFARWAENQACRLQGP